MAKKMGPYNSAQEFITALVPGAQKGYSKYGVFASVTIAQALGEAGWDMSQPCAYKDNNLFGVKTNGAHDPTLDMGGGSTPTDGTGGTYCHYASIADGVEDHGYFLKHNPRYEQAGVFSAKTPEEQASAIAKAGYATDGSYDQLLLSLIKQYNLKQYDTGASSSSGSAATEKSTTASSDSNPLVSWDDKYKPKVWDSDLSRVTKTSKNKKMSFFGADVQQPTTDNMNKVMKMTDRYAETRHFDNAPPGYYDNITYGHRRLASQLADESAQVPLVNGQYDVGSTALTGHSSAEYETGDLNRLFRLGDCYFVIPPEFINTTTKTSTESIQGLRQSGSIQTKNGYSRKEIQVSLLMNGMNQINGYEVESPFSHSYYIDGLRNVISQFKYTPFLPVENPMINLIHGVDNVALRNINVETVPGFPESLQVTISMQEFNAVPYLRTPNDMFGDSIDWDLFRYYTQKPLVDDSFPEKLKKIDTRELTAKFGFSVLTQKALDKAYDDPDSKEYKKRMEYKNKNNSIDDYNLYVNVYDSSNYEPWISDSDNIDMTHMSFSMGNIMPVTQLSNHDSPTMQYLGATDTEFTFGFETSDESVAAKFNAMNKENLDLVRANRFKNGIGFLKIENELVQLTGTHFLMMNDVTVSTMPGFPGTYSVTVTATSYDSAQKETEKLKGMRPFKDDRKGTRADLISMDPIGTANKISQDCTIMERFEELELYPDLHLPTYKEVDEAIVQIKKFRTKHGLQETMLFDKYPRHSCITPGSVKERKYEGFVDPDFYVMNLMTIGNAQASGVTNDAVSKLYDSKASTVSMNNNSALNKAVYGVGDSTLPAAVNSLGNISNSLSKVNNPADIFQIPKLKPDKATEPKFAYGYEGIQGNVHKGFLSTVKNSPTGTQPAEESGGTQTGGSGTSIFGSSADPKQVNKRTGIVFVDFACDRADAGCGYVWGATGQLIDQPTLDSFIATHGRDHYINSKYDARKWIGKQSFDCSGLIDWALDKCGMGKGRLLAADMGALGSSVSMSSLQVGDILYNSTHTAIYIGGGQVVEAAGTAEGVVYKSSSGRNFTSAVRITDLQSRNASYIAAHGDVYSGGSSSSASYSGAGANSTPAELQDEKNAARQLKKETAAAATNVSNGVKAGEIFLADFGAGNMCDKWNDKIKAHAAKYSLDPNMVKAFMMIESSGNPNEATGSAKGLMQINTSNHSMNNPFDPDESLEMGCKEIYECGSKLGFDKEKTITGYNAGMGSYEAIYVKKTKSLPGETKSYFEKYDRYYNQLKAKGAQAGNTNTLIGGGASVIAASGVAGEAPKPYDYNKYEYKPEDFQNPGAGKTHGDKVSSIDISKFGHAFVDRIATIGADKKFSFDVATISKNIKSKNDPEHVIEYMFVDQMQYSMKGLLCRAFPSYLFVIIDEQADYVDRKKLWSNYYVVRSAIDINIHEAYDSPVNTATVTLSNFYSNLTHLKVSKPFESYAFDDDEWFKKWAYETTGTIMDEEITDKMIEYKNVIYDDMFLEEGARIHIRLGYGSDPARYPTGFNGSVVQIDNGETVTIVAQSDGSELVNVPVTDKTTDTNEDLGLDEEVSDIIANMLVSRESNFWYSFSHGFFQFKSRYGIEHYGTCMNTHGTATAGSFAADTAKFLFAPTTILSVAESIDNSQNYKQYDIVKNIYKGTYEGTPYCLVPYNPFDGEYNIRFFCNGKTVWDVSKMCEKAMPDFIAYPRYFGFEQRLFYGIPAWLCRYEYNIDGDGLYEQAKSFAQMHNISSLDSIIDNRIRLDTRHLSTNMIGIYTLGGDIASTPVVMSDKNIDWSKQKTKTMDTTSVQDFGWVPSIIDKLLSWTGAFDNGKQLAIMTCVSELMNSWKETYAGNILIIGQPEIHPYDYVYLNDDFLHMNGMFTVREVIHSLSVGSGLTSSITPGLIANNTLKQSGMNNILSSAATVGKYVANILSLANASVIHWTKGSYGIKFLKLTDYAKTSTETAKNFVNGRGKIGYSYIKDFKILNKGAEFAKEMKTAISVVKDIKAIANVVQIGETALAAVSLAFPPAIIATIAVDIILNIALTWLYDMFAYDNTICLNPLYTTSPDGKVNAFVGNRTGQKTLLPGYTGNNESS